MFIVGHGFRILFNCRTPMGKNIYKLVLPEVDVLEGKFYLLLVTSGDMLAVFEFGLGRGT